MIWRAIFICMTMAWAANAAPVLVKSGEHDGFTRLVMEYAGPVEWKVGRNLDGYQLRVAGAPQAYDLSEAFKTIGKSRLAGISVDSASGDLQFTMACSCYAIPFEFRPGIVVIDLRDGKAPKGSSFELSLDQPQQDLVAPKDNTTSVAAAGSYDWTTSALARVKGDQSTVSPAETLAPLPSSDPALQVLRESLLQQLSRGAAQGMVDVAKLKKSPAIPAAVSKEDFESARISLGELPGIDVSNGLPAHTALGAQGQDCISAERLAIDSWGNADPVAEQMAATSSGLIGEFDKPNPEALQKAIQFHLFIGFGAEAQQLMAAFPSELADQKIWRSLANLVDDRPDPHSAFIGQEACDTPAALWAILAQPNLKEGQAVNADAAFLALSALPIDLRRSLGSTLADRLMAIGNDSAAKKVRDAILRSPDGAGPKTALLEAKIDMADGEAALAEKKLQEIVTDPGPETPAALIALVDARIAQDLPVAPEMVDALIAVAQEQKGSAIEADAQRALLLAKAASGDMDGAFELLPNNPELEPKVWHILSIFGTDDALLSHAVLPPESQDMNADAETRQKLAQRLLDLGMADAALYWVQNESQADPLLLAKIYLSQQDANAALRAVSSLDSPEALLMRAQALQMLGNDIEAAKVYAQTGDADAELHALSAAKQWVDVSERGPDGWKQLAETLVLPPPASTDALAIDGPLAKGKALVENSAATQAAIAALLAKVAAP